ncbi:MAG: GntR family transcriptional regulator [Lentisphaeria bacterium]|nr:GntR family transcriptional regulator [Lentisphaeria bacterium]
MSVEASGLLRVFPSSGVPIYRQVMDQVRALVLSGRLGGGELLPSVRAVALQLEVNPMTVSKAYSLLEAEGLVERVRGTGMRVCGGLRGGSVGVRLARLGPLLEQVAAAANGLALTREQVLAALAPLLSGNERSRE